MRYTFGPRKRGRVISKLGVDVSAWINSSVIAYWKSFKNLTRSIRFLRSVQTANDQWIVGGRSHKKRPVASDRDCCE